MPYLAALCARWRIMVYALAVGLLCVVVILHVSDTFYTSQLQVVAVDQGSNASSSRSQFSDIASLVGISMPADSESNFDLYLQGLTSRVGADRLAKDQDLMKRLYAPEWDAANNRWRDPSPTRRAFMNGVRTILGLAAKIWTPPDGARLESLLGSEVDVQRDKTNPVVTIVFKSHDPLLGRDLLWRLHQAVDNILRERVLARTSSYIDYLTTKLNTITVADYREAIIGTLSGQEKTRMAASSRLPFVAEPFGPPTSSAQPTSPRPLLVFLVTVILSLLVGGAVALWIHFRRPYWIHRLWL